MIRITSPLCLLLLLPTLAPARAEIPITGTEQPALAAFDRLMLSFIREHEVPGAAPRPGVRRACGVWEPPVRWAGKACCGRLPRMAGAI